MHIQEIEDQEFNRMGPADEAAWQHAHGMRCSFDCAACDLDDSDEWEIPATAARTLAPVVISADDPWR